MWIDLAHCTTTQGDMMMQRLAVGEPWPYPVAPGMQATLGVTDTGLSLSLAIQCDRPSAKEMAALESGPLRLAVMASQPITWIVLDAAALSYDAPYARGILSLDDARRVGSALPHVEAWPANMRSLVELYVIDRGVLALARIVTCSRDWWIELAKGVSDGPERLDRSAYMAAIKRQQQCWSTMEMIGRARIVEVGGRA